MTIPSPIKPFGQFPLNRRELTARKYARNLGTGPLDKLIRSMLWRYAGGTQRRARDITLFDDQQVRLHPYDNICEKRVFLTPHLWESDQRQSLADAIATHEQDIFYFIDAGANVGLYSLFARHCTIKSGKNLRALAIEPGRIQAERLGVNIAISGAQNDIIPIQMGLSTEPGILHLEIDDRNLGESRIVEATQTPTGTAIDATPLLSVIEHNNFPRVDGLKIDIEGGETGVMTAFFQTAPAHLWPHFVIVEIAHATGITQLFTEHRYTIDHQDRGLAVLSKADNRKS